ncbi:hypothetical protein B5C34_08425 [Pacificimonas flava]|uniref:Lipoprotein n=2 Tax=Pacificimonas TaxID=1960290 RepID=A0A219B525_9SPHN|nr:MULTISPECIES: hypothetical protein [Pacificimonas]MBZ6379312.1 hypothetical protein [Pacificimonas aurantium]OWV33482.1 hypothetical protein B5C34_08425 [Pacificimonas flava]
MRIFTFAALTCALLAAPAASQFTAEFPGDPRVWAQEQERRSAAHTPQLADLRSEALLRARWSKTMEACAAPPNITRLYGLQPAHADRTVANGILDDAFHGGWTFYAETDCAETPVVRYLYIAEKSGDHVMLVVNRGEVISTPSMMRETSALAGAEAYEAAKRLDPDCGVESVGMRQTSVLEADPALGPAVAGARFSGGWRELWDFTACARDMAVTVRFDTDGKGGTTARIEDVSLR